MPTAGLAALRKGTVIVYKQSELKLPADSATLEKGVNAESNHGWKRATRRLRA